MKNAMLVLSSLIIAIITNVVVMINDWGLGPKSWWWIIGVNTVFYMLAQISMSEEQA